MPSAAVFGERLANDCSNTSHEATTTLVGNRRQPHVPPSLAHKVKMDAEASFLTCRSVLGFFGLAPHKS